MKSGPVGNGLVYHVAVLPVKEKFCGPPAEAILATTRAQRSLVKSKRQWSERHNSERQKSKDREIAKS
jgi:hypothetical protein